MFARRPPLPTTSLTAARLGDIVTLPDGRTLTLRMLAPLPGNELGLDTLCILGDLEVLLATSNTGPVQVLSPFETPPAAAATARPLVDGAAAFWAPHLPAVGGAMGEVAFRLLLLRSMFAPLVVVNRGGDLVFFLRVAELEPAQVALLHMPVSPHDHVPVTRFAAVLDPVNVPHPAPQHAPQHAPHREPQHAPRHAPAPSRHLTR